MVFHINDITTKIQFATSREMPSLIYQACLKTGVVSNTAYCQKALAEALARDLGVPVEEIMAKIPRNRSNALHLFNPAENKLARYPQRIGPGNTVEECR